MSFYDMSFYVLYFLNPKISQLIMRMNNNIPVEYHFSVSQIRFQKSVRNVTQMK